jgi:drug/metabolite transporter (DMT)-like permease
VHNLEKLGTVIVLIGVTVLMLDGGAQKAGNQKVSIWGELLGISSSAFYALFFPLNRVLIK